MSHIKLVIVGDGDVGKTTLLMRKCRGVFTEDYTPTVFDTFAQTISQDGIEYALTYHDTAGQENYDRIRPLSYPNTDVFILTFAINNRISFANVKDWFQEIRKYCPQPPVILAGLKLDLRNNRQSMDNHWLEVDPFISNVEGEKLAKDLGCYGYHECSAKKSQGVNELLEKIALEAAIEYLNPVRPVRRRRFATLRNLMTGPIRNRSMRNVNSGIPLTEKLISCPNEDILRVSDKILKKIDTELPNLMVGTIKHASIILTEK